MAGVFLFCTIVATFALFYLPMHAISTILPLKSSTLLRENKKYAFSIHHVVTEGDHHLLITDGLRLIKQDVNEVNQDLQHIELYMLLPVYWNLKDQSWPVEWLNKIGQIPKKNNTWFGSGDTIPAGNPPEALDEKLSANHFILSKPISLDGVLTGSKWKESDFQLLAVIPIFQNEVDYKLKNSHTMLFNRFHQAGVSEMIDLYRSTTYKRRFFGLLG